MSACLPSSFPTSINGFLACCCIPGFSFCSAAVSVLWWALTLPSSPSHCCQPLRLLPGPTFLSLESVTVQLPPSSLYFFLSLPWSPATFQPAGGCFFPALVAGAGPTLPLKPSVPSSLAIISSRRAARSYNDHSFSPPPPPLLPAEVLMESHELHFWASADQGALILGFVVPSQPSLTSGFFCKP